MITVRALGLIDMGISCVCSTIWIRLGRKDSVINDRLSVHFYSVAFLAFVSLYSRVSKLTAAYTDPSQMSVAGIPECAYTSIFPYATPVSYAASLSPVLEERAVYYRESKNGLYTTLPFVLANTIVTIPFLFLCTVLFTVICYWAIVGICGSPYLIGSLTAYAGTESGSCCIFPFPVVPVSRHLCRRKPGRRRR